jgi:hypothetical protein
VKYPLLSIIAAVAACGGSSSNNGPDGGAPADAAIHADAPAATGPTACSAQRAQLIGAVNTVSTGTVTNLGVTSGATSIYVDASAGGETGAETNPWVFINLGSLSRVAVTDTTSITSTGWDLAIKRPVLYTNGGNGGPGMGAAVEITKTFATVAAADATGAQFASEQFFDAQCNPNTDPIGEVETTFSAWYDYNQTTHVLTPHPGTWLIKGGTGTLYKLQIDSYYANPDGSEGTGDGGTFKFDVEAL